MQFLTEFIFHMKAFSDMFLNTFQVIHDNNIAAFMGALSNFFKCVQIWIHILDTKINLICYIIIHTFCILRIINNN